MQFTLQKISLSAIENAIQKKERKIVLYCDFNVANILYEKKLEVPSDIILYPDSNLIHLILKWFYRIKSNRIVSTDLQDQLLDFANRRSLKIFLFGDTDEILDKVENNFRTKFPNISIVGHMNGYDYSNPKVINEIKNTQPDILLIGLGADRQEEWIIQYYNELTPIINISVGGYFKFLSNVKKRAPYLFRQFRAEWFYRLITEFNVVWKKYSINLLKFLYRVLTNKILFIYIPNEQ